MRLLLTFLLTTSYFLNLSLGQSSDILIKNVHIVHPEDNRIQENVSVFISNGLIQEIGKVDDSKRTSSTQVLDASGKYLMHGMIDAHVHFFQSGGLYTRPDAIDLRHRVPYHEEQKWLREHAHDLMKRYVAAGITQLCDVGGPMSNYEIRDQAKQLNDAPQLFVTGPLISTYQPKEFDIADPPIVKVYNPEEARELVRKQVPQKPSFIKIWYIVGAGQTAEENYPIVEATVDESNKHGIKVAVHATQLNTAKLAVKAGASILVHSVDDQEVDQEFIELLLKNKVSYIPTLLVGNNYNKVFSQNLSFSAHDFHYAAPATLGSLMDLKHIPTRELPSYISRSMDRPYVERRNVVTMQKNLETLFRKGVNVVVGTDAGNIGTLHVSSYFDELKAMQNAGLSLAEVLTCATVNGGKMLGNASQGVIQEGASANLILLSKNPMEDLNTLISPERVILRGNLFNPASLLPNSPEDLAQKQLNAYNARDIEAFLDCYHPEVKVYGFPNTLQYSGKENMRSGYSSMFENTPKLHCELVNRIVTGNVVMDQERVTGFQGAGVIEATAIYTIEDGLITEVRFVQ